jgi:hypothetical protein
MAYLMDMVASAADMVRTHAYPLMRDNPILQQFDVLMDKLDGTPRYLFDNNAIRTAVEVTLGRPKVLREALAHLRIPYPRMWIEWDDAGRVKLREKFKEELSFKELRPQPGRVGFLLETDDTGRRGTATWLWTTPKDTPRGVEVPNIGAVQPYFDLDRQFPIPADRIKGLLAGNLFPMWHESPVQVEALWEIWRTADHRPSAWGERLLALSGGPGSVMNALAYADVVGEYIQIWGCLLLLTAARPIVDRTPVVQTKLNKARARKGQRPLFDFVNVSLHLTPQAHKPVIRGALGYTRKSPRVHLVSSYLARRGELHWVVEPYWRGHGEKVTRRVFVRG